MGPRREEDFGLRTENDQDVDEGKREAIGKGRWSVEEGGGSECLCEEYELYSPKTQNPFDCFE